MSEKSDLHEIGGLWKSRSGNAITGPLQQDKLAAIPEGYDRLVLLPNRWKEPGDRKPDYRLFAAPSQQENPDPGMREHSRAKGNAFRNEDDELDDECPF